MPIRVKSRRLPTPDRGLSPISSHPDVQLPDIEHDDAFRDVVKKLSQCITDVVHMPSTFEQLRTTAVGDELRILVEHLNTQVTNPAIVNALLALRWHYGTINDGRGISEARANACEIVAWRFLTRLSEREAVEFCLHEIPDPLEAECSSDADEPADGGESNERTSLLRHTSGSSSPDHYSDFNRSGSSRRNLLFKSISKLTMSRHASDVEELEEDPTAPFIHLNALEIAAIADAKRFLSQHVVQKIITGIWNGEIIFWDRLSVHSEKKPRFYNAVTADPFSRLRVPKYLKAYEVAFFIGFLMLYYSVLIEQNRYTITPLEILLYIWFAAFFYDEVSEYIDAGSVFYAADVWNLFDMIMIAIGIVFAVLRFVGLYQANYTLVDIAFDVLSLEALFMVPRVCSILSLSPYWGTLIPCLKEMGKDFLKFMVLVIIVYVGFLTTFSLVGREMYTFPHMAMIVTKIFFGSSYVGFDIMEDIDPIFGPPLMLIFVTLSSILLMGSLTGMLSNSFSRVITHAREEYLYVYSVYVLEASTSNRLTHFYPPFNLLALGIFRPLRLFLPSDDKFRQGRILLLRATHAPIVGVIQAYEWLTKKVNPDGFDNFRGPRTTSFNKRQSAPPLDRLDNRIRSGFRPRMPTSRRTSSEVISRPKLREEDAEDYAGDAPSDMEVQISELSAKIDRLTALVVSLQSGAGLDTVRT
ncbi:ion transporter [Annulohypoxylon maeteangense]|uniref:ion transporter n=1 Tax=Annulohypoxylon maeteangense TaxID=1927788 RepID=UPI0020089518|nr:ion transporter [Annulohypoxylon maeteangense]KAI0890290.1 ion transporter [Annulohypoxylon maeteangense]